MGPLSRAVLFCTLPPDSKSWPSSSCTSSHICVWATYGNPLVCHFYIALAALCIPFNGWLLLKIRNWQIFWSILETTLLSSSWGPHDNHDHCHCEHDHDQHDDQSDTGMTGGGSGARHQQTVSLQIRTCDHSSSSWQWRWWSCLMV